MKPAVVTMPSPETLLASALFLMTNHARTQCPLLTRMIAQQLRYLAQHPSEAITPELRAVCEKLSGQWTEVRSMVSELPAGQAHSLLH